MNIIKEGMPTSTYDSMGNVISIGDIVGYKDDPSEFKVVFHDNAIRKKYDKWNKLDPMPILETGKLGVALNFEIKKKYVHEGEFLVLETHGGLQYAYVCTDDEGQVRVFDKIEDAQAEADDCQDGIVIEF